MKKLFFISLFTTLLGFSNYLTALEIMNTSKHNISFIFNGSSTTIPNLERKNLSYSACLRDLKDNAFFIINETFYTLPNETSTDNDFELDSIAIYKSKNSFKIDYTLIGEDDIRKGPLLEKLERNPLVIDNKSNHHVVFSLKDSQDFPLIEGINVLRFKKLIYDNAKDLRKNIIFTIDENHYYLPEDTFSDDSYYNHFLNNSIITGIIIKKSRESHRPISTSYYLNNKGEELIIEELLQEEIQEEIQEEVQEEIFHLELDSDNDQPIALQKKQPKPNTSTKKPMVPFFAEYDSPFSQKNPFKKTKFASHMPQPIRLKKPKKSSLSTISEDSLNPKSEDSLNPKEANIIELHDTTKLAPDLLAPETREKITTIKNTADEYEESSDNTDDDNEISNSSQEDLPFKMDDL